MKQAAFALLALLAAASCATVEERTGVRGGALAVSTLTTIDDAKIRFYRWTPLDEGATRVLIVGELGFDRVLVSPLAQRLQAQGFDVATLEGRHVDPKNEAGWRGWLLDVARAVRQHGPNVKVVAIGVGGEAALHVARAGGIAEIVAINVPLRHGDPDRVLEKALQEGRFEPDRWLRSDVGAILLASGRATPQPMLAALRSRSHPLPKQLQADVSARLLHDDAVELPKVPLRILSSIRDNLVESQNAFATGAIVAASTRRMGYIELFSRDYGHLDWLVGADALSDVVPIIAAELQP